MLTGMLKLLFAGTEERKTVIEDCKVAKELFSNVEIDTTQSPYVFKCQLYDLTGVPPERQKIMVKGGLLKDDADWSKVGVKEGQKLMMMGTADEIVKAPEKGPVFAEDMPEEELVVAVGHSAGLLNLGNTCYMNSTVQCLHSVPELKSALIQYPPPVRSNTVDQSSHSLTVATRELFNDLDKNVKPVAPMRFLTALRRSKYPQFAQLHNGIYMQQFLLLYHVAADKLSLALVHCAESGEESTEMESVYSLKCHISQEVNHLHEGLRRGLKSELEKSSPSLGRSAVYAKDSRINDLPRYLTIQFVRFFWKRESNQKAKILRYVHIHDVMCSPNGSPLSICHDAYVKPVMTPELSKDVENTFRLKVDYPLELDVYDFCSDDLRKRLEVLDGASFSAYSSIKLVLHDVLRDEEGKKLGLKTKESSSNSTDVKMTDAEGPSNGNEDSSKSAPGEGVPPEKEKHLTGIYDLVAVLTHKGRSADSGHYVAWVKQENGKWIQFDDDNPIPQREEDITKLSGGGDWHMAYICMYKARDIAI
ncbi:hypothetical protein DH2020_016225 [Rehmannia glutinosa]|uniref:Ubiquitin carboxyl-terminal hydrolase n=1 Tax=Rehmannia glutinosa TaxID=99300 RepID=A0ABR0WNE2_REHGL